MVKRCRKGVVKSGPRKGKCRKVCPKNCKTLSKARKAPKKRAAAKVSRRRANCEKWGFSVRLGRCRKGPARGSRAAVSDDYSFPASAWSTSPQRVPVRDIPGTGRSAGSSMILYRRR
jgi:hypothetical protein